MYMHHIQCCSSTKEYQVVSSFDRGISRSHTPRIPHSGQCRNHSRSLIQHEHCALLRPSFPIATLEGSHSMVHFQRTGLILIPWSTCTRSLWHQPITKYIHMITESGLVLSFSWCQVQGSISAIQIHFRLQYNNSFISPSIIVGYLSNKLHSQSKICHSSSHTK